MKREIRKRNKEDTLYRFKVHRTAPLLEFLFEKMTGVSKNDIKGYLKRHQVLVDGAPISQFDFELSKDDEVTISRRSVKVLNQKEKESLLEIIYEDDNYLAINKPSGLLSIPSDKEKSITAYRLMMDYVSSKNKHNRIYILHRIDKDTSGVLIAAKNEKVRDLLQKNWNKFVTKRGYYAICEGIFSKKSDTIKSWLRKAEETNLMYSARKMGDGKLSITHYNVIREGKGFSLLDVNIDSGRKNQIRVHMHDLEHPVIGDKMYGSTKDPINRLGLHAYLLSFKDPLNDKEIFIKAKMPKDFGKVFE